MRFKDDKTFTYNPPTIKFITQRQKKLFTIRRSNTRMNTKDVHLCKKRNFTEGIETLLQDSTTVKEKIVRLKPTHRDMYLDRLQLACQSIRHTYAEDAHALTARSNAF